MTTDDCEALRREIKAVADKLWAMPILVGKGGEGSEVEANRKLAYRHLEDAAMRLGKVIQALDGGVSVYDKTQVPGA